MSKSLEQINQEKPLALINFDYDKFDIREDAKAVLESNAAWMKKWRSVKILVEGHCDERGTEDYNLALGEKRAKAAYDYLIGLGIPAERMKIISYGKSQPLDMGKDESAYGQQPARPVPDHREISRHGHEKSPRGGARSQPGRPRRPARTGRRRPTSCFTRTSSC